MILARKITILALSFLLGACSASKSSTSSQIPSLGSSAEDMPQTAVMLINHRYSSSLGTDGQGGAGWIQIPESNVTLLSVGNAFIWGGFQLENLATGNCMHFDTTVGLRERTCQTSSPEQTFGFIPSTNGSVQIFSRGVNRCLGGRKDSRNNVELVVVDCVADLNNLGKVIPNEQLWRLAPLLNSSRRL
ncbi:hypothetical protein [Enterobacter cloacae]|uniref:hypothetical protein n=1 Tax=Enterobacter cloacae TaxID=550 RepID=UPI003A9400FD